MIVILRVATTQNFSAGNEENQEFLKSQGTSWYLVSRPEFEPRTSRLRDRTEVCYLREKQLIVLVYKESVLDLRKNDLVSSEVHIYIYVFNEEVNDCSPNIDSIRSKL